jgi:hypothetical protein
MMVLAVFVCSIADVTITEDATDWIIKYFIMFSRVCWDFSLVGWITQNLIVLTSSTTQIVAQLLVKNTTVVDVISINTAKMGVLILKITSCKLGRSVE